MRELREVFFLAWHWVAAAVVCQISEHVPVDITYSRRPYLLSKTKSHSTTGDLVYSCHVRTGSRTPNAYLGRKCKSGDSFNWSRLCHLIPFTDWPCRERDNLSMERTFHLFHFVLFFTVIRLELRETLSVIKSQASFVLLKNDILLNLYKLDVYSF